MPVVWLPYLSICINFFYFFWYFVECRKWGCEFVGQNTTAVKKSEHAAAKTQRGFSSRYAKRAAATSVPLSFSTNYQNPSTIFVILHAKSPRPHNSSSSSSTIFQFTVSWNSWFSFLSFSPLRRRQSFVFYFLFFT